MAISSGIYSVKFRQHRIDTLRREKDKTVFDLYDETGHPWKCEKCGEKFSSRKNFKEHKRQVHSY